MFKDIIETVVKELQNEKNQEHLYSVIGPLIYRTKTSFYIVIIVLIIMAANLIYSNILLSEIVRSAKKSPFTP